MKNQKGPFQFFHDRIWKVRLEDMNPLSAFFFKQLRIVLIVLKNYTKDNLQMQAAGLTFYTILSVVPVVALVFAIAKGFGFQQALEEELYTMLEGHQEVIEQVMTFATRMLENTQGGLLAGVGVAILLWTVMKLLMNIELSFNEIWQVAKGRSWFRRITEYFSIMLIAPIMIILAGSVTVVLAQGIEDVVAGYDFLQTVGPVIHFGIKMVPYMLIWLVFTFVYMIMPNTKVSFKSALVAGIIAGTSFQLLEWSYINFQVGVSKYNAIYGSFAALPLFMVWVNTSWLITLVGAEIAYANQFVTEIESEINGNRLSVSQRHVVALLIIKRVALHFETALPPLTSHELSQGLRLPFGITTKVLEQLIEAEILTQIDKGKDEKPTYLPHHSIEKMTVMDVVEALDDATESKISILENKAYSKYLDQYSSLRKSMQTSELNMKVIDLPDLQFDER